MLEGSGKEIPSRGFWRHSGIVDNEEIAIMQKVAPKLRATIEILAEQGEKFTDSKIDPQTRKVISFTVLVPKGASHIRIITQEPDISSFNRAVQAEKKLKKRH